MTHSYKSYISFSQILNSLMTSIPTVEAGSTISVRVISNAFRNIPGNRFAKLANPQWKVTWSYHSKNDSSTLLKICIKNVWTNRKTSRTMKNLIMIHCFLFLKLQYRENHWNKWKLKEKSIQKTLISNDIQTLNKLQRIFNKQKRNIEKFNVKELLKGDCIKVELKTTAEIFSNVLSFGTVFRIFISLPKC